MAKDVVVGNAVLFVINQLALMLSPSCHQFVKSAPCALLPDSPLASSCPRAGPHGPHDECDLENAETLSQRNI